MLTKNDLRRNFKALRDSILSNEKSEYDRLICKNIVESDIFLSSDTVLLYAAINSEIDTDCIFYQAKKLGKKTAYPKCNTASSQMDFYYINDLCELKKGAYGIREPDANALYNDSEESVLCIVPCLSCDKSGTRLGYGGGFYDRYFEKHKNIVKAALCYEKCLSENQIKEKYDIPVDFVVTESGIICTETK